MSTLDTYRRLTLPYAALALPALAAALTETVAAVDPVGDGTAVMRSYRPLDAVEAALVEHAVAFDCFVEGHDGETGWRRVYRPAMPSDPGQDTTLAVMPGDEPILVLAEWDRIAAVPGGAVTSADVAAYLRLPRESVAQWVVRHGASLEALAATPA